MRAMHVLRCMPCKRNQACGTASGVPDWLPSPVQRTKLEAVQALQEADALEKQSREDKEAVLSFLRKELGALKPVRCQSSSPHSGFSENSELPIMS